MQTNRIYPRKKKQQQLRNKKHDKLHTQSNITIRHKYQKIHTEQHTHTEQPKDNKNTPNKPQKTMRKQK